MAKKSPLEWIEEGIGKGDWKSVVKGFHALTGKSLSAPKPVVTPELTPLDIILRDTAVKIIALHSEGCQVEETDKQERQGEDDEEDESEPVTYRTGDEVMEALGATKVIPAPAPVIMSDKLRRQSQDFGHVHTNPTERDVDPEKGIKCRAEPHRKEHHNEFVDDRTQCRKEAEFDKKVTAGLQPRERRPEPVMIDAVCSVCGKTYRVPPILAPKRVTNDDEPTSFFCDNCSRRK